jgi:hypothetical protein
MSHEGDSGTTDRLIKISTGNIPAMKATTFQCMKVPRTWQSRMPNDIERVMEASRNPRYFGSLRRRAKKKSFSVLNQK